MDYLYPQNLSAPPKIFLWKLRDVAIIGTSGVLSVLSLTQIGFVLPLALTAVYAFLTIQFDDLSVLDFIKRAVRYFITDKQYYEWRKRNEEKR